MRTIKNTWLIIILLLLSKISFAQNLTSDTTLANNYFEKATAFYNTKNYDSAIVYFEKASTIYQEQEEWRKYLQSETKHGECYQKQWQLDNAISIIKPAIEKVLLNINENNIIVANTFHILGLQYYFKSVNDSTIFYWRKALQIKKQLFGEKHIDVAKAYNNIGIVYSNKNEFDLALQYYFKCLEIYKELFGEKHTNVATCYNNIGIVYSKKNEFDLALQYSFNSLQIFKEVLGEKHMSLTMVYSTISIIYTQKNEYDLALNYYLKELQIYQEHTSNNPYDLARNYNNIGIVYHDKNEFDLALEYLFKAGQIYEEIFGEKHAAVASNHNNIGGVYFDKNNFYLAAQYFLKSLQIAKEIFGEEHMNVSGTYSNLGLLYAAKKDYNKALEYYFKSLQIRNEILGKKHTDVATCYNNIGLVYRDKNEYNSALEYYFKALQIDKEIFGEKHTDVACSYNNIGNVYEVKNEYNLALKYYQKAIASSLRNFNDTIDVYAITTITGSLNWNELLIALQSKAEILANHNEDLTGLENQSGLELALRHYQACDTLINLARQDIVTKSDKIALGERATNVYEGAIDVCCKLMEQGDKKNIDKYKNLAFYFSEKNKSSVLLEALAGSEAQKFAGIPDTLLQKEHNLQIDMALYKRLLAEQPDSAKEIMFNDKLFNANREYDALIKTFENEFPEYFELKYNQKPAMANDIQKILDNKTAMLSYFTGDSTISIFTITKDNVDFKMIPINKNLADIINEYRYGLIYTNSTRFAEEYKIHAYNLYKQLIPENINQQIKNLIIIPDAELSMIPFETMLTENTKNEEWKELPYLIKKYNISYSYSANLFYKTFPKTPATKVETTELNDWLAFAPVFDDSETAGLTLRTRELLRSFDSAMNDTLETRGRLVDGGYISSLPGTESEVKSIFKEFEGKDKKALVQIKKNANEDFIKEGGLQNYRYIHFATHGFVNTEKPELSGIFLAQDSTLNEDGILYQGEIYNLDLNADLTVLSACETGLGQIKKGEGLIGLTRALLYAGSKNIIVSLWKVADESTSELMINFYKNFLEENKTKVEFSEALRQSKIAMIEEGEFAHPFYWSPFILIGK